ncbi:MAG: GMC family oxidoreductase [Cyclobacteriaceae bacterium]
MQVKYDLIVVGTGFASTFFLYQYLKKAPAKAKVLVLERGFLYSNAERRKNLAGQVTSSAKLNPLPHETYLNKNPEKHWAFSLGFGGSSNCWYACTPRFLPSDFKMKTLYGVGEDWPVQYNELEPYYMTVEKLMDISGPEETPFPKSGPYPLPPHSFTPVDKILKKEYGKLYINQPTARASRAVNGRNACCASAVCAVCPVNAKFTIENSNLQVYEDERVELIYGAQVFSVDFAADTARSINFIRGEKEYRVEGEVIALGANAIFNANILLNSRDRHPLTGKGLGEQLGLDVIVHLKDLENVGGSTWVNANGYMLYDGDHRKDYAACIMESNNAPFIRLESGKWRHVATFRMIFEDLPQEENYITLGENKFKPEAVFKGHSEYAWKAVTKMKQNLPGVLSCLPVENIEYREPFKTEAHILGTTRMGKDAKTGVVDKNMIHHHYRNLFVLGSGSFTTFTPNNPTLTLSALSLLAADRSF